MKVGDLVCYNAGGMKKITLGMVIDLKSDSWNGGAYPTILIHWYLVGKYMPRREQPPSAMYHTDSWKNFNKKIAPDEIVWHRHGIWFEAISESR